MRITDVNIDHFGVWRELDVPLNDHGVNVFYGPNEAGKSTLMRFVRGVLYGFRPQADGTGYSTTTRGDAQGGLRIVQNGKEHVIRREAEPGERGRARFDELDWGKASEDRIKQVVRDTSESMYENIFAIGLTELQELATLDADEVAEHIYGMSLGPDGERVLRARSAFEKQRQRLLSDDRKAGEIVRLASRLDELDREMAELGDVTDKHQQLRTEKERLTAEIADAQHRRSDLERQLRGHRFIDRAYGPWKRERQLRAEREGMSLLGSIPDDGLTRFDQLERELTDHRSKRDALVAELDSLEREADEATGDTEIFQHECTVRRLGDHREELRQRDRRLKEKSARHDALQEKFDARLNELGSHWTLDRISNAPLPSTGTSRLWDAARRYQQAGSKRKRTVNRYKKIVASAQKRQNTFNERIKPLGGTSLTNAIHATQRRFDDIRELNRLRIEEARLSAASMPTPVRQMPFHSEFRDLPPLFYTLMWFFTFAGIILFLSGLLWPVNQIAGGNTAWIVGAIYACFGLFMAGATVTVRQHLEQFYSDPDYTETQTAFSSREPEEYNPHAEHDLARVRQTINELISRHNLASTPRAIGIAGEVQPVDVDESDLLIRTAQRLADLKALKKDEQQIQTRRNRLSRYREIMRDRQRHVTQRRREWCDVLRDLGIDETLKVSDAMKMWQSITDAHHLRKAVALTKDDVDSERRAVDELKRQIDRLMGELPADVLAGANSDPDLVITRWRSQVKQLDGTQGDRAKLRRAVRDKRREADRLDSIIQDLSTRRSTLLIQAGVSSRDEMEQRMHSMARHRELARLIDEAQSELRSVTDTETELAIVEEDLLAFDSGRNKQSIAKIEGELKQIDHDLQTAHEEIGRVKSALHELANDRRAVSLRFEREQVAADLKREMEAWCSLDLSIDAVDQIRGRLERHAQSDTLQLASQYLDRLTVGKYHNVWSPLGERHLCIDDDADQTLRVEQLSTGTREQLFLAIRLAMVRRFAQEGIELPMVLDDVFVNFDQIRTEAAVDTILDFADQGHQIMLFTCHLHLAHMFEAKGIEPVWLPVNAAALEERRAG